MNRYLSLIRRGLMMLLPVVAVSACADVQTPNEAAELFCTIHAPSTWEEFDESSDAYEVYNHIVVLQKDLITNKRFKSAIGGADTTNFSTFYFSARRNIEELLGSAWDCDDFDRFYLPSQTVISLSLDAVTQERIDPNDDKTVVILIAHSGDVLIGNAPLATSNLRSIIAAITSRIDGRDIETLKFVLYADSGADGALVPKVLAGLLQSGVTSVSMINF